MLSEQSTRAGATTPPVTTKTLLSHCFTARKHGSLLALCRPIIRADDPLKRGSCGVVALEDLRADAVAPHELLLVEQQVGEDAVELPNSVQQRELAGESSVGSRRARGHGPVPPLGVCFRSCLSITPMRAGRKNPCTGCWPYRLTAPAQAWLGRSRPGRSKRSTTIAPSTFSGRSHRRVRHMVGNNGTIEGTGIQELCNGVRILEALVMGRAIE